MISELLAQETKISLVVLDQAAEALRDEELEALVERVEHQKTRTLAWLRPHIKHWPPKLWLCRF